YRRDESTYTELSLNVDCYNPNEPGSELYLRVEKVLGAKCAGHWQTKEQREKSSKALADFTRQSEAASEAWKAARGKSTGYIQTELQKSGASFETIRAEIKAGKVKARFPNFNAGLKKWNEEYEARVKKFPEEKQATIDKQLAIYDQARLMAKFSAHLTSGHAPDSIDDFCENYEKDQHRDADLALSGIRITMFTTEKDWKFARDYGLSEGEFSAIREYTAGAWDKINHALRYPKELNSNLKLFKATIDSGLDRLPAYQGDPVVRLDMPPPEVLQTYQEGSIVRNDAYTSTSKDPEWTNNPEGLPNHTFTFHLHSRGHDIEDLSAHPAEAEVLIKAGTQFRVISRGPDPRNSSLLHFELEEVGGDSP
ncbi:MAG: ADP-ribosyltransferase, partial [Bdellovibrionota bacterium]